MAQSMMHLNGNIMCVIDTETSGLDPSVNDLIQIAIMPLDSNIRPLKKINDTPILPFYIQIQPQNPEAFTREAEKVHGISLTELMLNGIEPFKAIDLLLEWKENLQLPLGKKIAPLGQVYPFDRSFIIEWLGSDLYNEIFDYHIRDTATAASFLNDRSAFHAEPVPFPKVNLRYLASQLNINYSGAHDALQDCLITADVYRAMLMQSQL